MSEKPTAAIVLALIGGVLGVIIAFILLAIPILGLWVLICNIIIIVGGILMNSDNPSTIKAGAILTLIFGIIGGINIIAIIGGALGLAWTPPSERQPAQPPPYYHPQPYPAPQLPAYTPPAYAPPVPEERTRVKHYEEGTKAILAVLRSPHGNLYLTSPHQIFGRNDFRGLLPQSSLECISRTHFKLMIQGGRLYIQDLNSTNGTFVNGRDIRGRGLVELKPGDKVNIANQIEFTVSY